MRICPECTAVLPAASLTAPCDRCGWHPLEVDGIPDLLATRDRNSAVLSAYIDHYTGIALDDLEETISGSSVIEIEADRLMNTLGDVDGLDVLEVGVGQGGLLRRLLDQDPQKVVAVDLALPYLVRIASSPQPQSLEVVRANAENLPWKSAFDLVVAGDVLEHILNPADFLDSANRALRSGGRMVVRVPYRENLSKYSTHQGYPYRFVHLRSFDRRGLVDLIEAFGFQVEGLHWSGFFPERLRIQRWRGVNRRVREHLYTRFGSARGITAIDPRIGRLLMRPSELTAVASKRSEPGAGAT